MAKLLPPIIEGTIPAFYGINGMVNITIPFTMNRAVNKNSVIGIAIKIKTLQSSSALCDVIKEYNNISFNNDAYVTFTIPAEYFNLKQFYKFQIAYIDISNEVGHYSSVGIGKYTSEPNIYIDGLSAGIVNYHNYSYSGVYQNSDYTENVYSYRFDLFDINNNIKFTTGDIVHNSADDQNLTETIDVCTISQDLGEGTFYLQYSVVTTNNLRLSTERYVLKKAFNISMDVKQPVLTAVADNENGCISLSFLSTLTIPQNINGNFVIYRSDESGQFLNWTECYYFSLNNSSIKELDFWQDYTVEHRKQYKYAIAQFNNNNLYSEKVECNIVNGKSSVVSIDFEDIFLFDGKKQLKIKYNPKISSFKNTTLEAKMETLGKQHPFIFRNGIVSYKEFPISGLITYLIDTDNNDYQARNEVSRDNTKVNVLSTDLTSENIYRERQFKLETLDWLTNGKPKLFRSPTEGNYIVRLLNVSLTPHDQLGRMLHTFNCTAYEIATSSYESLSSLGILGFNDIKEQTITQWLTTDLSELNYFVYFSRDNKNLLSSPITTLRLYDMPPGQMIKLQFGNNLEQDVIIGSTGTYRLENAEYNITGLELGMNSYASFSGYLTHSFKKPVENDFKEFNSVDILSVPVRQFIGFNDIIKNLIEINGTRNSKLDIIGISHVKFYQRPVVVLRKDGSRYYQHDGIIETLFTNFNDYTLYAIVTENNGIMSISDFAEYNGELKSIISNNQTIEEVNANLFNVEIGDNLISLKDSYDYEFYADDLSPFTKENGSLHLKINYGVIAEISYSIKSQTYILESNRTYQVYDAKQIYENVLLELDRIYQKEDNVKVYNNNGDQMIISSWNDIDDEEWNNYILNQRKQINIHYNDYILILEKDLYAAKIIEGLIESQEGNNET